MIRLTVSRHSGDLDAATGAIACAEALIGRISGGSPAQRAGIRAELLFARGAVELWSGRLEEAARVLDSGVTAAVASGAEHMRIDCISHLALAEALRGRLGRAAKLAGEATAACPGDGQPSRGQHPEPAALAALAWVHLEHHELPAARGRLKQVDAALRVSPDRLIGAVACLTAAYGALAEGRADVATQFVARARSAWSVPAWLEQRLSVAESRALVAGGDIEAALAAAKRAGGSPAAAVTLAHVWVAAGEGDNARRALAPVLTAHEGVPEWVRVQACLVNARLSYHGGDRVRGRGSLRCALRLAEREQLRLPFALECGWIGPVLQRDPELAGAHQHLLRPAGTTVRRWLRRKPPMRPRSPRSSRSPNANGKCCGTSRSC